MNKEKIINDINAGKIIIMPTDTTYGIVCDATNLEAVRSVFLAKKRDFNKPLIILVSDYDMLEKYTFVSDELTKEVILKYLPGPLSILLKKKNLIDDLVTANSPFVAVRIPDDYFLRDIIKQTNKPIIATSANISGNDIITDVKKIEKELLENIDNVYDGGILKSTPSTLIKIENNHIIILREGLLSKKIKKDYNLD